MRHLLNLLINHLFDIVLLFFDMFSLNSVFICEFYVNFSLPNFVCFSANNMFAFSFFPNISFILNISLLIKFKNTTQLQVLFSPKYCFIVLLYLSNTEFDLISFGNLL